MALDQEAFEKILNDSTNRPLSDYERKQLAQHYADALAAIPTGLVAIPKVEASTVMEAAITPPDPEPELIEEEVVMEEHGPKIKRKAKAHK